VEKTPAWQFSMRTLLIGVAGVAILCAIGNWIGAFWMSLTIWTLLMVVAHVGGLMISRRRPPQREVNELPPAHHLARGAQVPVAATKDPGQLAYARPLSGWVRQCTIGGVILGAMGGLGGMWILRAGNAYGLSLGTASGAVLGGFFSFMAASFLAIAANAFGEAKEGDSRKRARAE